MPPTAGTAATSRPSETTRHHWILCVMLFLATTLNYLDRQALSILAPAIQSEMGIDNEQLGWLFSVFYYTYTFAHFGIGLVLDRTNLRWAYGIAVVLWSLTAALTGTASSFAGLICFRLLLGIMESANWPAAMRTVARALPPRDRPLGNGIFTSGTSVGAIVAPILILGVAGTAGWRWAFAVVGALGLVWFAAWVPFSGQRRFAHIWTASPEERANMRDGAGAAYRSVLGSPQFWRVFTVAILVNPCLYFFVNWLPTYFAQQRSVPAGGAEMRWTLIAIFVGLDIGYLLCGVAVRLLSRSGRTVTQARRMVFFAATGLLMLTALVPVVAGTKTATALLMAANAGAGAWIAMYLTLAQEVSARHVSTAAGMLGGFGSLAGALAMWGVGRVTRQTGSFAAPMAAVAAAAALAAAAGSLATARARREEARAGH